MRFEVLKSEIIYQGRAVSIRRDHLKTPDGRTVKYDIIDHSGSVVLVPLDADGNLLFVKQYRHAAGLDLLELPAGTLDEGEAPDECARREIREETGMAADNLERIGQFFLAPGYSSEFMVVYLATGLRWDPLEADADEFLQVEKVPLAEALGIAERGNLPDAKSLAALFLARSSLEKYL